MGVKIFVDFDGTVMTEDVGNSFFREFGGPVCHDLVHEYREGNLSAKECFRREVAAVGRLPVREANESLHRYEVRPGFPEFFQFCRERGFELTLLSDGLDYYIDRILFSHGLSEISVVANRLVFGAPGEDGAAPVVIAFPYDDAECDRCACCKRNIMLTRSSEDDVICYIGDGISDRCAVGYADIVFARGSLQAYCQTKNISYHVYASFFDVITTLADLLGRSSLRKRRSAELRRRDIFMREP